MYIAHISFLLNWFLLAVARNNHEDADCFACAILSHGEEGYVYGKDKAIQIDRLVGPFKGHRCLSLAGKPKLFFIQVSILLF
jgi:hypothetical protein